MVISPKFWYLDYMRKTNLITNVTRSNGKSISMVQLPMDMILSWKIKWTLKGFWFMVSNEWVWMCVCSVCNVKQYYDHDDDDAWNSMDFAVYMYSKKVIQNTKHYLVMMQFSACIYKVYLYVKYNTKWIEFVKECIAVFVAVCTYHFISVYKHFRQKLNSILFSFYFIIMPVWRTYTSSLDL